MGFKVILPPIETGISHPTSVIEMIGTYVLQRCHRGQCSNESYPGDCYYYSWYILHILPGARKYTPISNIASTIFLKNQYFEGIRSTIGIKLPHAWAHAHIKNRNASRSWHETNCPFNPMGKGPPETSPRSCTRNSHSTQASHGLLRIVDLPLQVLIFNWSPVDHALDVVIDYAPLRMILGWEG